MKKLSKDKFSTLISAAITVIIITAMVAASEITSEKEIIFPEVAALSVGAFLAPKLPWKTNYLRMFLSIILCAILGELIVLFIPAPLWIQISVAYLISQLVFLFSQTTLAPMISAIVLPVMLKSQGLVYPISAITLMCILIFTRMLLDKTKIKDKPVFAPVRRKKGDFILASLRVPAVILLSYCFVANDYRFVLAPPLLVAFTELSSNKMDIKKAGKVILVVTTCACIGAIMRLIAINYVAFSLTFAAFAAAVLMVSFLTAIKTYLPPAAAMTFLAMLIPDSAVSTYPVQVFAGITVLTLLAWIIGKLNQVLLHT